MVGDGQSLGGRRGVPRRAGQGRAVGRDVPVRASESNSWLGAAAHLALAIAAPVAVAAAAAAASVACHRGIGGTCKGYGQFTIPQQIQLPVAAAGASPSTARSKIRVPSSGDVVAIWIPADLTSWRRPHPTTTTTLTTPANAVRSACRWRAGGGTVTFTTEGVLAD